MKLISQAKSILGAKAGMAAVGAIVLIGGAAAASSVVNPLAPASQVQPQTIVEPAQPDQVYTTTTTPSAAPAAATALQDSSDGSVAVKPSSSPVPTATPKPQPAMYTPATCLDKDSNRYVTNCSAAPVIGEQPAPTPTPEPVPTGDPSNTAVTNPNH